MYYVYIIASKGLGKSYVGMTKHIKKRFAQHKQEHKDWFLRGASCSQLSRHYKLGCALRAEAAAMIKHNTLYPCGLNRLHGGKLGRLSARLTKTERAILINKKPQVLSDERAAYWMRKLPVAPTLKADRARHRRAWARKNRGLAAIPGTEHYLSQPEHFVRPPPTRNAIEKRRAAIIKRYKMMRETGGDFSVYASAKGKKRTQKQNDGTGQYQVTKRIAKDKPFTWREIQARIRRAKLREEGGLRPFLGTEIFLQTNPTPWGEYGYTHRDREIERAKECAKVNAWLRQYGIDQGWIKP